MLDVRYEMSEAGSMRLEANPGIVLLSVFCIHNHLKVNSILCKKALNLPASFYGFQLFYTLILTCIT
jgi:hypothetical protein